MVPRFFAAFSLAALAALSSPGLLAASFVTGQDASRVLGQTNFTSNGTASGTTGFNTTSWVTVDPLSGFVFVADRGNHRILRFVNSEALANGAAADAVFGQANFSGTSANRGNANPSADSLDNPYGVFIDADGNLWVVDSANHRVLRFPNATATPPTTTANLVLGQADFVTNTLFAAGSNHFNGPSSICLDGSNHLWIADSSNNRVLRFDNASALSNGANASDVLGQTNFTNSTSATSNFRMSLPIGVTIDSAGRLWVADGLNGRMLRFDNAASLGSGASANGVLGKTNFNGLGSSGGPDGIDFCYTATFDATGRMFVNDLNNNRVLWWDDAANKPNGADADGVLGQENLTANGTGLTADHFSGPSGIFYDPQKSRLWVADSNNSRVLRFDPIDSDKPTVTISGAKRFHTTRSRLRIRGTASDPSNLLDRVEVQVGTKAFHTARGTVSWHYKVKLKPGKTRVKARAIDTSGNTSKIARATIIRD